MATLRRHSVAHSKSAQGKVNFYRLSYYRAFLLLHAHNRSGLTGKSKVVDLVPEGDTVPLTNDNRQEYVELYVDYLLVKSISTV